MATRIPQAPAEVSVALSQIDGQIRELDALIKLTNIASHDARASHEEQMNYSNSVSDMIGEMIALHEIALHEIAYDTAHDTAHDNRRLYYRDYRVRWQRRQQQVELSRRNLHVYLGRPE